MSKRSHIRIGVVVNTTMKPSRDVLHGIAQGLYSRTVNGRPCTLSFFLGSAGTKIENLLEFASQGMDALIFNGIARPLLFRFLQSMPNHPPVVFATYSPLSKDEWAVLGNGGVVMLDNRAIGHRAADFFIARGLSNFAMMGRVGYREDVAGRIRRDISRDDGKGLEMFVSGDQLLRGAALNAVEIAEHLVKRGLV